MFQTSKQVRDHELRLAALSLAVAELRRDHERSSNAELLKLISQLQDDLEATRVSLRSLHGKVAIQKRLESGNGRAAADIPDDEEFQKMLQLQNGYR